MLCFATVAFVGCDGDNVLEPPDDGANGGNNNPPPANGNAIALGQMRQLQDGDSWTYQVTGTFVPNGGAASPLTPADAVVTYTLPAAVTGVEASQVPDAANWSGEVPLSYNGTNEMHENVAAVSQGADGQLFLEGYSPAPGLLPVAPVVGDPLAGPDPANLGTINQWGVAGEVDGFGEITVDFTKTGEENVTVPAGTFSTIHGTGQKSLGGYATDYEVWVNPQLGCYVKMTTAWDMGTGELTLTHELKDTNVPLN
jgi:hypothetical protein